MPTREQIINDLVQQPYLQKYQDIQRRKEEKGKTNGNKNGKKQKNVKNLIPASKRLLVTYIVFGIWVGMAIFGILMGTDLISLSVYFASGLPLIIGYLWSETSRPSGSIKDVSRLVESMQGQDYWMYGGRGGGFTHMPGDPYMGGYGGGYGGYHPGGYRPGYRGDDNQQQQQQQNTTIIIISDDNAEKLEVKEDELNTLLNSGYVEKTKGKYIFRREKKEEIVSLIDGNEMRDEGMYAEEEGAI